MFKMVIGALALFVIQTVFVDTSVKVLSISHNIFTGAKVVYYTAKQIADDEKVRSQVKEIKELVDTAKPSL